jgi:hypothetical protein
MRALIVAIASVAFIAPAIAADPEPDYVATYKKKIEPVTAEGARIIMRPDQWQ